MQYDALIVQSCSDQLRDFIRKKRLSQARLADQAGVSQSTVSRALSGTLERHGTARSKLFTYALIDESKTSSASRGKRRVIRAFDTIWDGSESHAAAIAKIIEALADLRPAKPTKQGGTD